MCDVECFMHLIKNKLYNVKYKYQVFAPQMLSILCEQKDHSISQLYQRSMHKGPSTKTIVLYHSYIYSKTYQNSAQCQFCYRKI